MTMQTEEKQMLELITADIFAIAEREAAHTARTQRLIRIMHEEIFPAHLELRRAA
jgi:hypothetical protein